MSLYQQWYDSWFGQKDFKRKEEEVEIVKCDTKDCSTEMEYQEHYINGGICWKCIDKIGK